MVGEDVISNLVSQFSGVLPFLSGKDGLTERELSVLLRDYLRTLERLVGGPGNAIQGGGSSFALAVGDRGVVGGVGSDDAEVWDRWVRQLHGVVPGEPASSSATAIPDVIAGGLQRFVVSIESVLRRIEDRLGRCECGVSNACGVRSQSSDGVGSSVGGVEGVRGSVGREAAAGDSEVHGNGETGEVCQSVLSEPVEVDKAGKCDIFIGPDGVVYGGGRAAAVAAGVVEPEEEVEAVPDAAALKREKRKRKKAARKARKAAESEADASKNDVPEWRRYAGPPSVPRPEDATTTGSSFPKRAVNAVKSSFRPEGFFNSCREDVRNELAESRARRFIAENALKTAEAEGKVRSMQKKGATQFMRDLTANLQAVAKLRKAAADNKKVSGWVDAIASRSVEELSSDASGVVPPLSDFVGEDGAAIPSAATAPSGETIDYKRKAEYLEEKAKLEEHFDYIGAYENWQYEEAFDRLKQRYIDVAGTPTERIDVDIQDRLFELMDNDPNPEKFEYVLDKLNTMRNKMYVC